LKLLVGTSYHQRTQSTKPQLKLAADAGVHKLSANFGQSLCTGLGVSEATERISEGARANLGTMSSVVHSIEERSVLVLWSLSVPGVVNSVSETCRTIRDSNIGWPSLFVPDFVSNKCLQQTHSFLSRRLLLFFFEPNLVPANFVLIQPHRA
jgi:hypothetical protein